MLTYREFGQYGVQTTYMFALEDITDAEAPFTGTAPLTADIWISKDGAATANATNAFTAVSNGVYTWVATAAEMQATRLCVNVYDATASAIFKPVSILIQTKLQLGQIDVNATQIGGNVSAMSLTGVGTGAGLFGTSATPTGSGARFTSTHSAGAAALQCGGNGGAGIEATSTGLYGIKANGGGTSAGLYCTASGASAIEAAGGSATGAHGIKAYGSTADSHGILGTGAGTGAGIAGLGGNTAGSGIAGVGGTSGGGFVVAAGSGGVLSNIFDTVLTSEPTTAFAATDTYGKSISRLMRRFYNKVTQTVSQQKQYRDDSTTVVDTMAVSDDATTQTKGKSA